MPPTSGSSLDITLTSSSLIKNVTLPSTLPSFLHREPQIRPVAWAEPLFHQPWARSQVLPPQHPGFERPCPPNQEHRGEHLHRPPNDGYRVTGPWRIPWKRGGWFSGTFVKGKR